jgi:hypothetical protein
MHLLAEGFVFLCDHGGFLEGVKIYEMTHIMSPLNCQTFFFCRQIDSLWPERSF